MNNEVVKNILERRSWRSFEEKQIAEEELQTILECGLWAPSAMNQQSWHLTVLQNKALIQELTEGCKKMMGRDADPFYGAPTLVLVTGKGDCIDPIKDGSLAIENMFLAAASLGVGSCWINCLGRFLTTEEGKAFAHKCGMPQGQVGVGCVILGYPKGDAPQPKERAAGSVTILK